MSHLPSGRIAAPLLAALLAACSAAASPAPPAAGVLPLALTPGSAPSGGYALLYRFGRGTNGYDDRNGDAPNSPLVELAGRWYGVAANGGNVCPTPHCDGVVYSLDAAAKEGVAYDFGTSADDGYGADSLAVAGGHLVGTTAYGPGSSGFGTAFELDAGGRERILHRFTGGADGAQPTAIAVAGATLYVATQTGGGTGCYQHLGCGTIAAIGLDGKERVLYAFRGGKDGENPAGLVVSGNTIYGTTMSGGTSGCKSVTTNQTGCGTFFTLSPSGVKRTVYAFKGTGAGDGQTPQGKLAVLGGAVYGTTVSGGSCCSNDCFGCGTVFEIAPQQSERVIYRFESGSDGAAPFGGVVAAGGALYGTTFGGGDTNGSCSLAGCGTVFEVGTNGTERILHRFGSDDGYPTTAPSPAHGKLLGVTLGDGVHNYGTVYEAVP